MITLVRLQKHLARAGIASRRGAEAVILAGRVRVNGQVVSELGTKVDPERDRIEVDGRQIEVRPALWLALNKPRGFVSTRRDPQGRRTVYDLLSAEHRTLFTIGRLDIDSEGLLLLTNDGDAAERLLHPRYGVEREYAADVDGVPTTATLDVLRRGVTLEDGEARARRARLVREDGRRARVALVMTEGRKREVRRMLEAVGHPVKRLRRVRYGPIRLGELPAGQWRQLEPREVARLAVRIASSRDDARRGNNAN
jgi:pseudouridine synthase